MNNFINVAILLLLYIIKVCLFVRVLKALTDYIIFFAKCVSNQSYKLEYGKHIIMISIYTAIIMAYYTFKDMSIWLVD